MFTELNTRLVEVRGELRKKEKYQLQLADYIKENEVLEERLTQLRNQFKAEQVDVEKLEGFSLTNLFATLAGTKDEKLTKEKQDLLAAQHKLEEAAKTKIEIEEAIQELNNKLDLVRNAEYEYQQLLLQKENSIMTSSSPYAREVLELSEQEGNLTSYIAELEEAKEAGERVKYALKQAIYSLEKAENWGTWDMFGGGTISGVVKHQHIDEAEKYLHQAQTRMRQFQKELLDVEETAELEVNISDMLKFADFFFDGFIADYMVQGKISRSLRQTEEHYDKVSEILIDLSEQYEKNRRELQGILEKKRGIVEKV
jgi:DNA repair exonuclease SbcCD ATPase subunit